jgi:hypothetical protein
MKAEMDAVMVMKINVIFDLQAQDTSSEGAHVEDASQINQPAAGENSEEVDGNVILDWKGDPMRINPGDKLPFF